MPTMPVVLISFLGSASGAGAERQRARKRVLPLMPFLREARRRVGAAAVRGSAQHKERAGSASMPRHVAVKCGYAGNACVDV